MNIIRRNHYDVTDAVYVADPREVSSVCCDLLRKTYPKADWTAVEHAFNTFGKLYTGTLPGYVGCETWYHDAQHSLDCALAIARLLDGYENSVKPSERLGERRVRLGVIAALFHDAGYIRKNDDPEQHGAEFTLYHVRRSGEFMADYLPQIGFGPEVPVIEQIIHYTGYEMALDKIRADDARDHKLGFLLGSADVLAQMSDRCYLEKCRDFLYAEFEICGLAGAPRPNGRQPLYSSPEDLLIKTQEFKDKIWRERMDGYFGGVYKYAQAHFGDHNHYMDAIDSHLERLKDVMRRNNLLNGLRRRAECVNAIPLRRVLGIENAEKTDCGTWPPPPHNRHASVRGVDPAQYIPT